MISKSLIVLLVVCGCILSAKGRYVGSPIQGAEIEVPELAPHGQWNFVENFESDRTNSHSLCLSLPFYGDFEEIGSMTFFANATGAIECGNCELSGIPAVVTCNNTNAKTDAVIPAWICSAEFPTSFYEVDGASVDCDRPPRSPLCFDLRTCRLKFSVKKIAGKVTVGRIILFAVTIVLTGFLLGLGLSMLEHRSKAPRSSSPFCDERAFDGAADDLDRQVTSSSACTVVEASTAPRSRSESVDSMKLRADSPPPSYEEAILID